MLFGKTSKTILKIMFVVEICHQIDLFNGLSCTPNEDRKPKLQPWKLTFQLAPSELIVFGISSPRVRFSYV